MKNIIKQTVGIDISKDKFDACYAFIDQEQEVTFKSSKEFENNNKGFNQLISWVTKHQIKEVPLWYNMEATGVYYEELCYYLDNIKKNVSVILPSQGKQYAKSLDTKSKTDKLDAKALARMGLERKLEKWEQPSPLMKELKGLTRERTALVREKSSLKNQLHAKNHSYKPSKDFIKRIGQRTKMLGKQIKEIEKNIKTVVKSEPELFSKVTKIEKIKGLRLITIITVIAETNGFSQIKNISQLVSYSGLDVVLKESGKYKGKTKISKKGNSHIRSALYLPAISAGNSNKNLKIYYQRISERKTKKKMAIIAVMRKLLVLIYVLWKNNADYNENYQHKSSNKSILIKNAA